MLKVLNLILLHCILPFGTVAQVVDTGRFSQRWAALGTLVEITVFAPTDSVAEGCFQTCRNMIEALDGILSDYRPDSEVNRLVQTPGQWIPVSLPLFELLTYSRQLGARSGGALNVQIGALSKLWRSARASGTPPRRAEIRKGVRLLDTALVDLDQRLQAVRIAKPGLSFDFGAIGKGYIADQMAAALRQMGITVFLIDLGGDLVAGDAPPSLPAWQIQIPWASSHVQLCNASVASSGPDYQFLMHRGRIYSHIIDPRTGWGVNHVSAATVVAPLGWQADALASIVSILPIAQSVALLESLDDIDGIMLTPEGLVATGRFSPLLPLLSDKKL